MFLWTWVFYMVFFIQLWSLTCERYYLFSWLQEFRVVMIGGWEILDIFILYSFIKWSHCKALAWLLYFFSNIVIFGWNNSLYFRIWKFFGITKLMSSSTHNRISMINIILSNSRISTPISIWQWPIRWIKIILSPTINKLSTY